MNIISQTCKLGSQNEIGIYLARPDGKDAIPAILLFPGIAGVNDHIRRRSHRLAAKGYAIAALDYFSRESRAPDLSSVKNIKAAVAGLPDPRTLDDARQVVSFLRKRRDILDDKIAAIGFCVGGMYALQAGCEKLELSACINFYGTIRYDSTSRNKPISPLDRVPDLAAPLLCHYGDADHSVGVDDITALSQALRKHQKNFEFFNYAGAPHAFDEDFRNNIYRPAAAHDAWRRTDAFLSYYLDGVTIR